MNIIFIMCRISYPNECEYFLESWWIQLPATDITSPKKQERLIFTIDASKIYEEGNINDSNDYGTVRTYEKIQ